MWRRFSINPYEPPKSPQKTWASEAASIGFWDFLTSLAGGSDGLRQKRQRQGEEDLRRSAEHVARIGKAEACKWRRGGQCQAFEHCFGRGVLGCVTCKRVNCIYIQ